jgi:ribonuclease J
MNFSILRGSSEIGGSCVKITSGSTTIIIDMGMPLYGSDGAPFDKRQVRNALPLEPGLYAKPLVSAILVSHAHSDHYGLLSYSSKDIPIYSSKGTRDLIGLSQMLDPIKTDLKRFNVIEDNKSFTIGNFEITPYVVDHSAFDAMAFLTKADGKAVFYSGDFRRSGNKGALFQQFCRTYQEPTDMLLLEGTLISGVERENVTEKAAMEAIALELGKEHSGYTFISYASQNIDRFVSIYKACVKTGKTIVIDPYSAAILDIAPSSVPKFNWGKHIKVYFTPTTHTKALAKLGQLYKYKQAKVTYAEITTSPEKYVITDRYLIRKKFKSVLKNPKLIWSMWSGYLKQSRPFWDGCGAKIVHIHASGHADVKTLRRLVEAVKPGVIVPIHTQNPELYKTAFPGYKVRISRDGDGITVE